MSPRAEQATWGWYSRYKRRRSSSWLQNGCRIWDVTPVLRLGTHPEMERPAILNRSMPSTAGATISIPPARAVDEAFLREVPPAVKNAIYNRYREYTRWRALFPGTFVPVLTRRLNYQQQPA